METAVLILLRRVAYCYVEKRFYFLQNFPAIDGVIYEIRENSNMENTLPIRVAHTSNYFTFT